MSKLNVEQKKLKSKIKSYDPKEHEVYKGLKVAEEYIGRIGNPEKRFSNPVRQIVIK